MASSSSTHRVKTPDKQQNESNQTLETAHKSKFITPTSTSEHKKEESEKRGNRFIVVFIIHQIRLVLLH